MSFNVVELEVVIGVVVVFYVVKVVGLLLVFFLCGEVRSVISFYEFGYEGVGGYAPIE